MRVALDGGEVWERERDRVEHDEQWYVDGSSREGS